MTRPSHAPRVSGKSAPGLPRLEQLERRSYFASVPLPAPNAPNAAPAAYSYDGTGNNLAHPTWGSANTDLLRVAPTAFADGISAMAGPTLPGARAVSNAVMDQGTQDLPNSRNLTAWIYAWGQLVDHDLDLTPTNPSDPANIPVPTGDPSFDPNSTGTQTIPFDRSVTDPATGTSTSNPRQFPNVITSFLDGSVLYGSSQSRADSLRTFSGGTMKTSAGNLLPFNTTGLPNANDPGILPADQLFASGDVRTNENVELSSILTLFVREHNRLAGILAQQHSSWSDEQLYQAARRLVTTEIQDITYNEFLPALLGPNAISAYHGYNPNVNPSIAADFSEGAYRFGHSQLGNDVQFLDNNGNPVRPALDFSNAFFNPAVVQQNGIDPILKYLSSDNAQEVDTKVEGEFRNFLFGAPGQGGLDLIAADIQRARDVGLPDYNSVRQAYGLPRVTSFAQITSDPAVQAQLQQTYGDVNHIDLIVGGLAEDHVPGSSLGPTFQRIIADQFQRTRDGDRLWSQLHSPSNDPLTRQVQNLTLSDVISLNTSVTNLQANPFFFTTGTIAGYVTRATGSTGPAAPNVTLQLLNSSGTVLSQTTTANDGSYHFDNLTPGTSYQVHIVTRQPLSTPATQSVLLANGDGAGAYNVNFTLGPAKQGPAANLT